MNKVSVRGLLTTLVVLGGVYLQAPVSAATDPFVGASVSGRAKVYSLICGTCPIDATNFPALADGGPGSITAAIAHAEPGYAMAGHAALTGPVQLPTLGASAFADVVVDPAIPKTFFYAASVTAEGLQRYTYTGASAATYQLDYVIDGSFALEGADAASLMQVFGGMTVYKDGFQPGAEVNPNYGFDFKSANASAAGTQQFNLTGSVNFTIEPGDAFYVRALLGVTADSSHQVSGMVDALHTMNLSFSVGDTSLLNADLTAVPLPASLWLLLAPLSFGLGVMRRGAQI